MCCLAITVIGRTIRKNNNTDNTDNDNDDKRTDGGGAINEQSAATLRSGGAMPAITGREREKS